MRKRHPALIPASLVIAAGLSYAGMRAFAGPNTLLGWMLMGFAALFASVAFTSTESRFQSTRLIPAAWRARPWALCGAILGLVSIGINVWAVLSVYRQPYNLPAVAGWVASLVLLLAATLLFQGSKRNTKRDRPVALLEVAIVLAILALAIFLRTYRMNELPPGTFIDETNAGLDALHIMDGRADSPFATSWYEVPTMYMYYMAGLFSVLGTTWEAVKIASLIPAALTVAAVYPLARTLFGVHTALAAMFLLAVSRWHLILSRWGWVELAPPLFNILGVFFLVRAARNRRLLDAALCGLMFGLGMYTYLSIRLVVAAVAIYLVYRLVVERGFLRRNWAGLMVALLVYLMTFAPLATTYIRNPFTFLNRTEQVSILNDMRVAGSSEPLIENLKRHAEMFTVAGDRNARHNLPGDPMIDPFTGALFLIGAGYAVWQITDHRRGLWLIWIAVTLAGGVFSSLAEAPQAFRTLTALPALCILAGDALARISQVLIDALARVNLPGPVRSAAILVPVTIAGLAGYANITSFFDRYGRDDRVYAAFSPTETATAREVQSLLGKADLYLSSTLFNFSPVRFYTYSQKGPTGGGIDDPPYDETDIVSDIPVLSSGNSGAVFLLEQGFDWAPDLLRRIYGQIKVETVNGPRGGLFFYRITVPGTVVNSVRGLDGNYEGTPRRDSQINFNFPRDFPVSVPYTAITWTGSLRMPASGELSMRAEGGLSIEVDGEPWNGRRFLGRGLHALRLRLNPSAQTNQVVLLWQMPGRPEEVVPANALYAFAPSTSGLVGRYFRNGNWSGPAVFTQTAPLLVLNWPENEPWSGPFSAQFSGYINAPVDGRYGFNLIADDGVRLWLDEKVSGESLRPDQPNTVSVVVELKAGKHPIRVDFFQRGGGKRLEMFWQPPNGPRQPVPPDALSH